jgi:hypothetical protein
MGRQGFLVASEAIESYPFIVVGFGIVRVQAQSLFIGCQSFTIVSEVVKSLTLAVVGRSIVGVQGQSMIKGDQGFGGTFQFAEGFA